MDREAGETQPAPTYEPGSFRDRGGRVFYRDGEVLRALSPESLAQWEELSAKRFFARLSAEGKIVATEPAKLPAPEGAWAGTLRHARVPFVSYPYEWPFGMLKDAALLELELLRAALGEGMTLKDASPYNVQWAGSAPQHIDVLSFAALGPGQAWTGYRQFCELFLYPLLLRSVAGVPFQPWLRGRLEGIDAASCARLLGTRALLRPRLWTHVHLQAWFKRRYAGCERRLEEELRAAGFHAGLIEANAQGLEALCRSLAFKGEPSAWSGYDRSPPGAPADQERKEAFVRAALESRRRGLVWDLGCNRGRFSRLAARGAEYVVAMDSDAGCVEALYGELRAEGSRNVLALQIDLADPSPGMGWLGLERKDLPSRGRPELTLCLSLLHHMVLGAGIPLGEVVDWLAGLGGELVVEFVEKRDPLARTLLLAKEDRYADYDPELFEARLSERFLLLRRETLPCATRRLYHARARPC